MKKIIVSALILGALTACTSAETKEIKGAIIPHHLFVENYIDEFYAEIQNPDIKRVILLSPNHFNFGFHYIQTNDQNTDYALLAIEPLHFEKEHGITIHRPFINKYFPNAGIVPIITKVGTPEKLLDSLAAELSKDLTDTLIIASVDFTHYTEESFAWQNDQNTIKYLENPGTPSLETLRKLAIPLSKTNDDATAIDSPESIYLLLKLMESANAQEFSIWKRTSTATVSNIKDPDYNTSHIFGRFFAAGKKSISGT